MIRFFDLIFSLFGLILFSPILILLFVISYCFNRSPLFRQTRVGYLNKPFILVKFRTMSKNTRSIATHLVNDASITPFGKFLRVTKLDEVPQLWNVLLGDMSLVGPRPCLFNQKRLISERKKRGVFKVKPGITGLAQISNINMKTPLLLAKTDSEMIKKLDLYNYFYLIFKTLKLTLKKNDL